MDIADLITIWRSYRRGCMNNLLTHRDVCFLVSRSGLVYENAVEVFYYYGVLLSLSLLGKIIMW